MRPLSFFHSVKNIAVLTAVVLLYNVSLNAGIETSASRLSGSAVIKTASVTGIDNEYNYMVAHSGTWYNLFKVASGKGRVRIGVDHGSLSYVGSAYDYNFLLKIDYQDTTLAAATTIYRTVHAAYDPTAAAAYQDAGMYEVNNVKVVWIKVTIDSIYNNLNSTYVSSVSSNMFVEASTEVERYYVIDYTNNPISTKLFYSAPNTAAAGNDSNEVRVEWNYLDGAEEYELEWEYENDFGPTYSTNHNDTLALSAISYDFTHNSTRITTSDQHYNIPLLFDRGYLLFRIRAVGRAYYNTTGEWKRVYGKWTTDTTGVGSSGTINNLKSGHRYHITQLKAHETNKNWQYIGTFAEEGKKKEVVSYYDGSLRNRQTVTKTSTDKKVLVGETFYDFQGRAAVTALPAPVPGVDQELKFYDGFNRVDSSASKTYSRYDFDYGATSCVSSTLGMKTTSGASNYYSPSNAEATFAQAWLPDAKKYPFAQVEYMPDNTGRVRSQGGVGPDHQLAGGHETKYFYGQPFQEELDRIFGSEAGYKKHYNKTVTIDANGQASVTYLDQEGRTVATALAGTPPSNLQSLKDGSGNPEYISDSTRITVDLLGKDTIGQVNTDQDDNILSTDGKSLSVNTQLTVVNTQYYGFTYSVTGSNFHGSCMPTDTCYQCVYDMTIFIKSQCGDTVSQKTQKVGSVNYLCSAGNASFTLSPSPLNVSLSPGVYTVTKTLTVNDSALDLYTTKYISQNTCVRTEQSFVDSAMAHIDTSGCHITCTTCADADYVSPCEASYQMMLDDVSPGGQYAEYLVGTSPAPTQYPLSVLNDAGNQLPMQYANWRHPRSLDSLSYVRVDSVHYFEIDDTTISRIPLVVIDASTYTYFPPVQNTSTAHANLSQVNGVWTIEPQYLANVSDFISFWNINSWAKSLVVYHPEYIYFQWCDRNTKGQGTGADTLSSDEFDSLLVATTTVAAAHAKKLIDPLGNADATHTQSNCKDPYFRAAGQGSAQFYDASKPDACEYTRDFQHNGVTIWKLAKIMDNCGTVYGTSTDVDNCLKSALGVSTLPTNDTAYITTDADWIKFRDMYLSIKQHFQQGTAADTARYWDSYNGCIGTQQYNPFTAGMYSGSSFNNWPMWDNYDTVRRNPCGWTYPLYQNKTKRFPDENDLYPGMASVWTNGPATISTTQTAYNNYLITGQCPNALDLQGLLNAINTAGHLKATNDSLYKYPAFTQNLYNAMVSSGWHYPLWSGSGSSATLTGSISGTGASCTGGITLTFPSGSFSWSGYNSSWRIDGFSQLICTSATNSFTVVASVDDDMNTSTPSVNTLLSGTSGCIDVSCSFSTNTCEPTGEAIEVFNLMNLLAANASLYSVDTLTSGNTGNYFNNTQFRSRFSTGAQYWKQVSGTNFKIYDGSASYPSYPSAEIVFSASLPGSVSSFSDLTVISTDTLQVKAYNGSYTTMKFVVLWHHSRNRKDYDDNIPMGSCGASTPMSCAGDEYQRRDDLQNLLFNLAQQTLLKSPTPSVGTPLDTCSSFTALLEAPLGFSSYQWKGDYSGNVFTGIIYNNTTSSNSGTVTLTFTSTPGGGKTWADVRRFSGLWADESNLFNGVAYNFTANAWFNDGTSRTITGTSCYGIRNCSTCMANAGNKYENFEVNTTGFGSTLTYTSSCPGTGYYTTTAMDSALCHDTTLTGIDHTQPGTGKYFFTKYSSNGAQTLWKKATTYTAYTPYTFSVWYMDASVNTETQVTLELWMGSTQLTSVAITDNAGVWKKLSVTWNGANTAGTDTLKIKTSGAGGVTTRLGLDDIGFYTSGCDPISQFTPSPPYPYCDSCRQHLVHLTEFNAHQQYEQYIDSVKAGFQAAYIEKCIGSAVETFGVTFTQREYHYTLYYYDQGGNLVRTVPPAGVVTVDLGTYGQTIKTDRHNRTVNPNAAKTFFTSHTLVTTYTYNSLNQMVKQATPDGDTTRFWFDKLGKIVASQNAKQKNYGTPRYSYTVYDAQGRIAEVGELATDSSLSAKSFANLQNTLNAWNYPDNWDGAASASNYRFSVTKTYYDATAFSSAAARFTSGTQDNLRKRIVSTAIYELYTGTTTKYSSASHYSYDIHGNVKEFIEEDTTLRTLDDVSNSRYQSYKKMQYFYDLVSGKVNQMWYEDGQADALYHTYDYDGDNRVTAAYTSSDKRTWDCDAKYFYYQHGALARTEIGQNKVQAEDYAYTLQGWKKGVNSNAVSAANDMGHDANSDGTMSTLNQYVPLDQYGYELTYYDTLSKNDYASITTNPAFAAQSGSSLASSAPNLWNGNIKNMVTSISEFMQTGRPQARAFRYDQLNRITQAQADTAYSTSGATKNTWVSSGNITRFRENFTYDANGNILTLIRHGNLTTPMDSLNYHYASGTNQLTYVDDAVSSANYSDDIDDQSSGNYTYDKTGNLISDVAEQIDTIRWNAYGKIEKVIRTSSSSKSDLEFRYNPMGERICKIVKPRNGSGVLTQDHWTYTYYMRDASGNVIATYDKKFSIPNHGTFYVAFRAKEYNLYGSSRVGIYKPQAGYEPGASQNYYFVAYNSDGTLDLSSPNGSILSDAAATNSFLHKLGLKYYELANHLGNVLVTVSDMRTANSSGGIITGFNAVMQSASDYYAFGSQMEAGSGGRNWQSTNYRYGFNGKEKDDEINDAAGSDLDFGDRIYDARLGRWLSVDPLEKSFGSFSPYVFSFDSPIMVYDKDGKTGIATIEGDVVVVRATYIYYDASGKDQVSCEDAEQITKNMQDRWNAANGTTTINGKTYQVRFEFTADVVSKTTAITLASSPATQGVNLIGVGTNENTEKHPSQLNLSSGYFNLAQDPKTGDNGAHEITHNLGVRGHPDENNKLFYYDPVTKQKSNLPGENGQLMMNTPSGSYTLSNGSTLNVTQGSRQVTQADIDNLGLDKLLTGSNGTTLQSANVGTPGSQIIYNEKGFDELIDGRVNDAKMEEMLEKMMESQQKVKPK